MLRKFKKAAVKVDQVLSLGCVNTPKTTETVLEIKAKETLMIFYREMLRSISFEYETKDRYNINRHKTILFRFILCALLAEIYKTANCGDYVAVGLLILFKMGIQKKLDVFQITDAKDNHCFIIYNRDPKSAFKDFKNFGHIIFFDTWPGIKKVIEFSGQSSDTFSLDIFKDALEKIIHIDLELHIENDFTYIDWLELSLFLYKKISLVTEKLVQQMLGKNYLNLDAKVETRKIREKFARESQLFGMMGEKIRPLSGSSLFNDTLKTSICAELLRITGEEWKYSEKDKAAIFVTQDFQKVHGIESYLDSYYILAKHERKKDLHILKLTIPHLADLKRIPVKQSSSTAITPSTSIFSKFLA